MRLTRVGVGLAMAVLLASTGACAAPPGPESGTGGKGETGGKGGLAPTPDRVQTDQTPETDLTLASQARKTLNPDQVSVKKDVPKSWEIAATWETHRLVAQQY